MEEKLSRSTILLHISREMNYKIKSIFIAIMIKYEENEILYRILVTGSSEKCSISVGK